MDSGRFPADDSPDENEIEAKAQSSEVESNQSITD